VDNLAIRLGNSFEKETELIFLRAWLGHVFRSPRSLTKSRAKMKTNASKTPFREIADIFPNLYHI
jgi:hypothetical protein